MKFHDFYLSNVQFRLNLSIVRTTLGSAKLPKLNEDNKYTPTHKARLHPLSLHSLPRCYPKSWILEGLDSIFQAFQAFQAFPAYPNPWIAFSSLSELFKAILEKLDFISQPFQASQDSIFQPSQHFPGYTTAYVPLSCLSRLFQAFPGYLKG